MENIEYSFVRKFRWLLEIENLSCQFMKKVSFDFTKKIIKLQYYEVMVGGISVFQKWIDSKKEESINIKFTVLDYKGESLYQFIFDDCVIVSEKIDFDYSNSDSSFRKIKFKYKQCNR